MEPLWGLDVTSGYTGNGSKPGSKVEDVFSIPESIWKRKGMPPHSVNPGNLFTKKPLYIKVITDIKKAVYRV